MTLSNESLEEKVERLEYYIDLLRDYIVDQEHFILWDWAIAHRLNRNEVRAIIDVSKAFDHKLKSSSEHHKITLAEYAAEIQKILITRKSELSFEVDNKFVIQMLKRMSQMKLCNQLTDYFLQER